MGAALAAIGLDKMPENVGELESAVRKTLRRTHPDHNFNSTEAQAKTRSVLDARTSRPTNGAEAVRAGARAPRLMCVCSQRCKQTSGTSAVCVSGEVSGEVSGVQ